MTNKYKKHIIKFYIIIILVRNNDCKYNFMKNILYSILHFVNIKNN